MAPADARRLAEGRGVGRGAAYRPWLTVQEVPSHGLSSREYGLKTGRDHHLFSRLESNWFVLLEHAPAVLDIREQFPLLPLGATLAIAQDLGIAHPRVPGTGYAPVCTTDLVVTLTAGGATWDAAVACKLAADLEDERVLEKLELERRYWAARGVPWHVATERELPTTLLENIRWVRARADGRGFTLPTGCPADRLIPQLLDALLARPDDALAAVCLDFDDRFGLPDSTALALARHALATRRWDADFTVAFTPTCPLPGLRAGAPAAGEACTGSPMPSVDHLSIPRALPPGQITPRSVAVPQAAVPTLGSSPTLEAA